MTAEEKEVTVTILARLDDSDVLNLIGSFTTMAAVEPQTDENRQPGDAPEAKVRATFNLATELRKLADIIEEESRPSPKPAPDLTKYDADGTPYTDKLGRNLEDGWG